MTARFRALYGASPLHLLALVASLLVTAAAFAGWFHRGSDTLRVIGWFVGAILAHDIVLLPLYSLLDRIAFGRRAHGKQEPRFGVAYLRVPALLSGLIFLVFFGEILRLGDNAFHTASGLHQDDYLVRYLLVCAALFVLSGLAYALHLARLRKPLRS